MKMGITGHQKLDNPDWIKREILRVIKLQSPSIIGVTSLAVGADQFFAQAVLDCTGSLQVIVPCKEYIKTFDLAGRLEYERLLSKAVTVEVLPALDCDEDSYFSAGK